MSTVKGDHIITRIQSSKYTLKWSIDKFAELICNEKLRSPVFYPISGSEWNSTLEKFSSGVEWEIYNRNKTNVRVQHEIKVIDHKGIILFEKTFSQEYSTNCSYGYLIKSCDKISLNDSKHVITFICHMTLMAKESKSDITEFRSGIQDSVHNLQKLSNDLKTMYDVSLYTDTCLRVKGTVLRAHRALLCARSPVFAKMFEHELNEKETKEINITDLDGDVLKQLISFLYTGIVLDENFDSILSLYYAADKYDVTDLRQRCRDILMNKITVENACTVLALAERHSDDSLKKSALLFVETHMEPLFATEGWREFLKAETSLAAEILMVYTEKRKMQVENQNLKSDVPIPPDFNSMLQRNSTFPGRKVRRAIRKSAKIEH